MQINSASSYTPQSNASLAVDNQNQVAQQRDSFRVQQAQKSTEQGQQGTQKSAQQTQEQNKQPAQVERFDVDEKALALVEKAQFDSQQASTQSSIASQSAQSLPAQSESSQNKPENNSTNQQGNNQSRYDSPSQQNQTAVAAYSSVGQIAQRENIQQVFGVDLFA